MKIIVMITTLMYYVRLQVFQILIPPKCELEKEPIIQKGTKILYSSHQNFEICINSRNTYYLFYFYNKFIRGQLDFSIFVKRERGKNHGPYIIFIRDFFLLKFKRKEKLILIDCV